MKRKHPRRAVFLLDAAVALAITATVMLVLTQAVFQLADHRQDRKLRQIAVDTLMNVNEMIDFETDFEASLEPLQEMAARTLPEGKLVVETLPREENRVEVQITVSYSEGANRPRREYRIQRVF